MNEHAQLQHWLVNDQSVTPEEIKGQGNDKQRPIAAFGQYDELPMLCQQPGHLALMKATNLLRH